MQLAHGLNLTVVAEGVETSQQHEQLTNLGCDSCQGYYFARPMTADNLDALVNHSAEDTTVLPRPQPV